MSERPDTDDYRSLFLSPTPMMDMRAPAEFTRGAFPTSLSLPLMSDDERAKVGICYKNRGQEAAIELGHQLVSGDLKDERLGQWVTFAQQHPQGYLYCFRGGLRSQTVQRWLREAGIDFPLVTGGYKAMRRFLLEELERAIDESSFILISGKTGTGKTRVIAQLSRAVDLEGLANHRGSSFGQMPTAQPSQIDFENGLSIALMRLLAKNQEQIFLEDEGRLIGSLALPESLREKMGVAPMLVVEQSLEQRIDVVIDDYVVDLGQRYALLHLEDGPRLHCEKLQADLARIRKRLGGVLHQQVSDLMAGAFARQWQDRQLDGHRQWIAVLLEKYYDPMYEYQLSQRSGEQLFVGNRQAVIASAQRHSR
jgi:tRNA 2-selenouridine synthase|tara:strand:+ start:20116 stop:21213 length:1098 start_codon:yes stop_codon:yes gene_type:complete